MRRLLASLLILAAPSVPLGHHGQAAIHTSVSGPRGEARPETGSVEEVCVSQKEYNRTDLGVAIVGIPGVKGNALRLQDLEALWGVRGARQDAFLRGHKHLFEYTACGYSLDEVDVWVVTGDRGDVPRRREFVDFIVWNDLRDPSEYDQ